MEKFKHPLTHFLSVCSCTVIIIPVTTVTNDHYHLAEFKDSSVYGILGQNFGQVFDQMFGHAVEQIFSQVFVRVFGSNNANAMYNSTGVCWDGEIQCTGLPDQKSSFFLCTLYLISCAPFCPICTVLVSARPSPFVTVCELS